MRLRPRHYVLIVVIVALGVYNLIRSHRAHPTPPPSNIPVQVGPISQSPAWQAFDKAADLRDAPDAEFQSALATLKQQMQSASSAEKPGLDGCETWLLFYRQNAHAAPQDAWRQRSTQHLNTCVNQHRDVSS